MSSYVQFNFHAKIFPLFESNGRSAVAIARLLVKHRLAVGSSSW
jgi:hypothetical protein